MRMRSGTNEAGCEAGFFVRAAVRQLPMWTS